MKKTIKQVKEIFQYLKIQIEAIKKTKTEEILSVENQAKWAATTNASTINRMKEMEERIMDIEYKVEKIDSLVKKEV